MQTHIDQLLELMHTLVLLLPDIMHAHRRLGFTSTFGCASEVGHVSISKCVLAGFFFFKATCTEGL